MNLTETVIIFINAISMTFAFAGVLYATYYTFSRKRIQFAKLYRL